MPLNWPLMEQRTAEHVAACLSAKQIAEQLTNEFKTAVSRNAVIGFCSRRGMKIGMARPVSRSRVLQEAREKVYSGQRKPSYLEEKAASIRQPKLTKRQARELLAPKPAVTREETFAPLMESRPVSLVAVRAGQCRWPVAEKPFRFCGAAKTYKSFCLDHARMAYTIGSAL